MRQSFLRSLSNLGVTYVDSLVLHGTLRTHYLSMEVWNVFEELHQKGNVRQIGLSNIYDLSTLEQIYTDALIKPAVLQNRFYADTGYDVELRKFCQEKNIIYQSFWTLVSKILYRNYFLRLIASMANYNAETKPNLELEHVCFKIICQIKNVRRMPLMFSFREKLKRPMSSVVFDNFNKIYFIIWFFALA